MEPLPNQGHQLSGICAEFCPRGLSETVEYTIQSTAYSSLWGTELNACVDQKRSLQPLFFGEVPRTSDA